jgi:hypothetical protein
MQELPEVRSEVDERRQRDRSFYAIALALALSAVLVLAAFFVGDFTSRIHSMDLALSGVTTPTTR